MLDAVFQLPDARLRKAAVLALEKSHSRLNRSRSLIEMLICNANCWLACSVEWEVLVDAGITLNLLQASFLNPSPGQQGRDSVEKVLLDCCGDRILPATRKEIALCLQGTSPLVRRDRVVSLSNHWLAVLGYCSKLDPSLSSAPVGGIANCTSFSFLLHLSLFPPRSCAPVASCPFLYCMLVPVVFNAALLFRCRSSGHVAEAET